MSQLSRIFVWALLLSTAIAQPAESLEEVEEDDWEPDRNLFPHPQEYPLLSAHSLEREAHMTELSTSGDRLAQFYLASASASTHAPLSIVENQSTTKPTAALLLSPSTTISIGWKNFVKRTFHQEALLLELELNLGDGKKDSVTYLIDNFADYCPLVDDIHVCERKPRTTHYIRAVKLPAEWADVKIETGSPYTTLEIKILEQPMGYVRMKGHVHVKVEQSNVPAPTAVGDLRCRRSAL